MKLLLDERVDRRLARELYGHTVETVHHMGWAGKKNGELLKLAEQKFDVFITTDQNLSFQQNLPKFNLAVLILHAPTNRLADLIPLIPQILTTLPDVKNGHTVPHRLIRKFRLCRSDQEYSRRIFHQPKIAID